MLGFVARTSYRRTIVIVPKKTLLAVGIAVATLAPCICGFGQAAKSDDRPAWITSTKPEQAPPASSDECKIRRARSAPFDMPGAPPLDAPGPRRGVMARGYIDSEDAGPLPIRESHAVVIAQAIDFQPYFSNDHSSVYTELRLIASKVLKDKSGRLSTNSEFISLIEGGSLKLADGRIVTTDIPIGANPIHLRKRYLLFLGYDAASQTYAIMKAWDFSGAHPEELVRNGHPRKRRVALSPEGRPVRSNDAPAVSADVLVTAIEKEIEASKE
jgi:hypothetical protein